MFLVNSGMKNDGLFNQLKLRSFAFLVSRRNVRGIRVRQFSWFALSLVSFALTLGATYILYTALVMEKNNFAKDFFEASCVYSLGIVICVICRWVSVNRGTHNYLAATALQGLLVLFSLHATIIYSLTLGGISVIHVAMAHLSTIVVATVWLIQIAIYPYRLDISDSVRMQKANFFL